LFSARRVALLLLAAVSMVGMFGSIDSIRDAKWTTTLTFNVQEQRLSNYMFGSPAAFADWYAHAETSDLQWGARTFAGEFEMLRLKERTVGAYSDMTNVIGTEITNVYTLFRGLIEDYSEMGAVLIAVGIGAIAESLFALRLKNARSSLFCLSAFYAFFLFSPLVSLFSFNGPTLAWIVAWFVLKKEARPLLFPFVPPTSREAEVL
jgi:oligosaccharide repeat unit polymerase